MFQSRCGYAVIHAEGNRLLTARGVSIWMHLSGEASAASNHAVNPRVWTIAGNVVGSPVKCCQPWEWKKDLTRRLS